MPIHSLTLLPTPRQVTWERQTLAVRDNQPIVLQGDAGALLDVGREIQNTLATQGVRWEVTAYTAANVQDTGVRVSVDPTQVPCEQGYQLVITPGGIRLTAHDLAGAFYGAMTLRQIVRQSDLAGGLPCVRIDDWPDFAHRGVMLDISRDRVPTMAALYQLVDLLAEWKVNQFQLYTEHTFAYRRHREVWEQASPMTAQEILELDAYCRQRFVELVPNQNSFGHMNRWLQLPRYRALSETPDGYQAPWGAFSGPNSLCPQDPGALALMEELFAELLPHFSSRQINIGCDETWDLGMGRSKDICEQRGKTRVYLDFLKALHGLVRRHDRTTQFWADIILHNPELISELPDHLIALEWGYEADHPFAEHCRKFADSGVPFYVCPGTSAWNTLGGRTDNAIGNLHSAAKNGLAHGAIGYLNTNWGDGGNWEYEPVSYLGYACGAAVSWCHKTNEKLPLPRALDLHAFHDSAGVMGQLAYDLGNAYQKTGVLWANNSILCLLLRYLDKSPYPGPNSARLTVKKLQETEQYIKQTLSRLSQTRMQRADAKLIVDEFRNAGNLMLHACHQGVARLATKEELLPQIAPARRKKLAAELRPLIKEHRRLWLKRSRPGGLKESANGYEALLKVYEA